MRDRAWRRSKTWNHINRQMEICRNRGFKRLTETPHASHKKNALNCGVPNCVMCGNPRRIFGEHTMQERRFECKGVTVDEG